MQKNSFESFLHEMVFLFMSVVFAGTIYVIPQIFLLKYYPDSKNTLLTLLVVAGTVAAIIGVWMSNNQRIYKALAGRKYPMVMLLTALTILFDLLYFIKGIFVFLSVLVAVKFISNFLYSYLDTSITNTSGENGLKQHVKAVLLYQLLAYIIAPVYFSALFFKTPLNVIGVSLISILSIFFIFRAERAADTGAVKSVKADYGNRLDKSDWSFLLYSILVQVGMMIISSLIIFILKDYYFYEDAVLKGGILVGYISFISVVTIFITAFVRKKHSKKGDNKLIAFSTGTNYIAMALFFISCLLLLAKLSNAFIYLLIIGTLTGAAYGLYLHSTRSYANLKANVEHKTRILVHYNNIPNIGTLLSLNLVYVFTRFANMAGANFNRVILSVDLCICLLCALSIANYSARHKKYCLRRDEHV